MLQSENVILRRSSDTPLRRLHDAYGSEDNAETQLEHLVLAGERRVKGHAPVLTNNPDTSQMWATLTELLADLSAYGALGTMGGADQRFCKRLQPLLTRLIKCVLNGGFEVIRRGKEDQEENASENPFDADDLLQVASKALANCSEGIARRCADTTLEVHFDPYSQKIDETQASSNAQLLSPFSDYNTAAVAANKTTKLCVCFGFADYSGGETGAMLWAGAVGLSLYLIENYVSFIVKRAREVKASTGQPLRVIELGCGPALVSLVLAAMAAQEPLGEVPCRLDVTDISSTVVDEARCSFRLRNGPVLSSMLMVENEEYQEKDSDRITREINQADGNEEAPPHRPQSCFQVHPFILDFSDIPHNLYSVYDVVVASDVVYDHTIASHVAPAIEALLKPGGVAFLCCEAHRDGMSYFTNHIRAGQANASHLRVMEEVPDVQTVLSRLQMLTSLTASTCSFIRIEKVVL